MRMTQCDPFKCILTYAIFMRWIQIPSAHLHLNMNGARVFLSNFCFEKNIRGIWAV